MRKALFALPLLAGCTPVMEGPVPPRVEGLCDAAAAQSFVGQAPSQEAGQAIMAATRARVLRWAAPEMMMTMEFSPIRVTVRYGTDYRISQITCG